jgi:ABC-type transporter Mla subunit MlaD
MVCIVQDIDRWLCECDATVEHDDADGTRVVAECTLPAGHQGAHEDGAAQFFGGRVTGELRDLADSLERISQDFGWRSPAVDRDLTGAPGKITNSHDALANLASSLDTVRHRAARLAADVRDVCASLSHQYPVAGVATVDRHDTFPRTVALSGAVIAGARPDAARP